MINTVTTNTMLASLANYISTTYNIDSIIGIYVGKYITHQYTIILIVILEH